MKCRYKYCRYGGEVKKDEAIKDNGYYHKECYKEKEIKAKIRKLYIENIDKTVVYKVLNSVITDIVNTKNIDAEYLLFVVEYIIKHDMKINYPYGLHYYINNKNIKQAWRKRNEILLKQQLQDKDIKTRVTSKIDYNIEDDENDWSKLLG
jgi:hypothetical protein